MKTPVLTLSTFLPLLSVGQIYYEVHTITVDPPSPTPNDAITITLHGTFTNTGAYIVYVDPNYIGNTLAIDISAASLGGSPAVVPHDEPIFIGTLAAGTYTIQADGAYMVDNAPGPDHTFVVGTSTGVAASGPSAGVQVSMQSGQLCATAPDGSPLGDLTLIDPFGRMVAGLHGNGPVALLDVQALASGCYVLWMRDRDIARRVVLER